MDTHEENLRSASGVRRHLTTLRIRRPLTEVFGFFSDVRRLEFIRPPGLDVRVLTPGDILMRDGATIDYAVRLRGVSFRWSSLIRDWAPPLRFVDEQRSGPFSLWYHLHTFAEEDGAVRMDDEVLYRLPLRPFGELAAPWVRRELRRIFDFRTHKIIAEFGAENVEEVFSGPL